MAVRLADIVALTAILASSCGSDSVSGPTPSATSFDGNWSGTAVVATSGVGAVQFTVQNNLVTRFSLTYQFSSFPPGCTFTATESAAISNGSFGFAFQSTNRNAPGLTTRITGTLTSASSGRINTTGISWDGVVCGSSTPLSGASTPTSVIVGKDSSQ